MDRTCGNRRAKWCPHSQESGDAETLAMTWKDPEKAELQTEYLQSILQFKISQVVSVHMPRLQVRSPAQAHTRSNQYIHK